MNKHLLSPLSLNSTYIELLCKGRVISKASAFTVAKDNRFYLITNRHCVTGLNQDTNKTLDRDGAQPDTILFHHRSIYNLNTIIKRSQNLRNDDDSPKWIEHPTLSERADIVAIELEDICNIHLNSYEIENMKIDFRVGPADLVTVIGFPFGIRVEGNMPIWVSGFVASEPSLDVDDLPVFLIDSRTRSGMSGSPVIAYRSDGTTTDIAGGLTHYNAPIFKFLGVYSGRINKESDLGKVWKAEAIAALLAHIH